MSIFGEKVGGKHPNSLIECGPWAVREESGKSTSVGWCWVTERKTHTLKWYTKTTHYQYNCVI